MKTTTTIMAVLVLLAAAGCKQHGDNAQRKTKFPGMVTADGMSLVWFSRLVRNAPAERVYGPDLMRTLTAISRFGSRRAVSMTAQLPSPARTRIRAGRWVSSPASAAIRLSGTAGSQPLPSAPQHMMTVWQQQKMGWMAIAHSVSQP